MVPIVETVEVKVDRQKYMLFDGVAGLRAAVLQLNGRGFSAVSYALLYHLT